MKLNKRLLTLFIILSNIGFSPYSNAFEYSEEMQICLLGQIAKDKPNVSIKTIKDKCTLVVGDNTEDYSRELSKIELRIARERATQSNPSVITPHKRSYFLPVTYIDQPNEAPFREFPVDGTLDNFEAKFQISFKAPIFTNIFNESDIIHMGFTIQSYWQMYNSDLSSPFRETNYQPEIFYSMIEDKEFEGWHNRIISFGFEHQSNGHTQLLSRSWNRLYAQFVFEKDDWVVVFKPWYRLPEKDKVEPNQADGDDNPDIHKYMGYFELTTVYQWKSQTLSTLFRNNLQSDNKGAIQIDWSFPMGKRFKGYVQYFNGYGESLIDYDQHIQRLGIGILLTDFF
ncbi:MAG: phospholipase [Kangiella sp.]|nr:MAG: phospholipase [Kangiella sp.]